MWKALDLFGAPRKEFFAHQFQHMDCIAIGLKAYPTKLHQLHFSKNSFIKPHIDKNDLDCSFICWFIEGHPQGGEFGIFQHCMKLQNNIGAGIFVFSKYVSHGTLRFDANSLSTNNFKLGLALVNKSAIRERLSNQLTSGKPITWIDYIDHLNSESQY